MKNKTISGNETLGKQIKSRRNELGLTIEEAATRAGVGTKTWYRYEAGESIRSDKCKGICKALNWRGLPEQDTETDDSISIQEYKDHEAWSKYLEKTFGVRAAISFAIGSDILLDQIEEDLNELSLKPVGTHIGELDVSWLKSDLPQQFMMHYDYDFLYHMKSTLQNMRNLAKDNSPIVAHSVLEELILYLCNEEASALIELSNGIDDIEEDDTTEEWVFDILGDMDIVSFLYSDLYLDPDHPYHFLHWNDQQFYIDKNKQQKKEA